VATYKCLLDAGWPGFLWDTDKAASNASTHGVRFEQARGFPDRLARYEDASPDERHGWRASVSRPTAGSCISSMLFGKVFAPPALRTSCGNGGKETL
jgi:hypothetical protein